MPADPNNITPLDLSTKHPNDAESDYKAEIIAASLINRGYDPEQIQIIRKGTARRGFSKEVEEVFEQFSTHVLMDYLYIKTNKEGLYDMLPQGLFHQPVHKKKFIKDKEDALEAILPPQFDADCVVHFRPDSKWDGSNFGFDWIRVGDSQMQTDKKKVEHHYATLMGKYMGMGKHEVHIGTETHMLNQVKICDNENKWENMLNGTPTTFQNHIESYNDLISRNFPISFKIPWKLRNNSICPSSTPDKVKTEIDKSEYTYYVPVITLRQGKTANLKMLVEVDPDLKKKPRKPLKIIIKEQNETEPKFTITHDPILVSNGRYDLTITCNELFSDVQFIEAFAVYEEQGKEVNKRCGQLRVLPNDSKRDLKLVYIKVDLQIKNNNRKIGEFNNKDITELKKLLNQAMIDVNDSIADAIPLQIDTTNQYNAPILRLLNSSKELPMDKKTRAAGFISGALGTYLHDNNLYFKFENYLKVCVVDLKCIKTEEKDDMIEESKNSGVTYPNDKFILIFNGREDETLAHEILHGMGLHHSFVAKDLAERESAAFTYMAQKTENIMDYSHNLKPPVKRVSTWYWQWEFLWDYMNLLNKRERDRLLKEALEKLP